MKILVYILMSVAIMTSCKMSSFKKGVKGNGNMVSKEIVIDDYNNLSINDKFDVIYTQKAGEKPYLRVEIDENLLEYVSATVENNKLTIRSTIDINPKYYKIYTNSSSLSEITASGISDIELKDSLNCEDLHIAGSGMGHIKGMNIHSRSLNVDMSGMVGAQLGGKTENINLNVSGKANINAYELKSQNANCNVSGIGDINVYATEKLSAQVSGIGKINYKGNPKEKDISKSGIGSIKAKE